MTEPPKYQPVEVVNDPDDPRGEEFIACSDSAPGRAITGKLRPATGAEAIAHQDEFEKATGAAKAKVLADFIAAKVVAWDCRGRGATPLPVTAKAVGSLPENFIYALRKEILKASWLAESDLGK